MTTDLTGDFGVDEEEFDWDVFLPDPDEAEMEAEAASLEDETELSLDDSDFDWEGALGEDAESENGAEDGARAGAAYDRIVDTVRRSFEEPEPAAETTPSADAAKEPEALLTAEPEPEPDAEPELQSASLAAALFHRDEEPAPDTARDIEVDSEETWKDEPGWVPAHRFVAEPEPEAGFVAPIDTPGESDLWPEVERVPVLGETDPEPAFSFEPDREPEPAVPRFAESAAYVGVVGAVDSTAMESTVVESTVEESNQPDLNWAMAPSEPWEVDGVVESTSTSPARTRRNRNRNRVEKDGEGKQRSRVFKATVALACLLAVLAAAAVGVRALHRPTTAAAPPVHATAASSSNGATTGADSASAAAAGTARLQTATDAVDSATTAATVGISSLAAFPTPTNVETVMNPYISSLQLYETFLTGTKVPPSAQPAAASAETQLRQDLQFLDTIDGLPPQQLGAFLVQFDTDATKLQTTLSTLEQNLRSPSS